MQQDPDLKKELLMYHFEDSWWTRCAQLCGIVSTLMFLVSCTPRQSSSSSVVWKKEEQAVPQQASSAQPAKTDAQHGSDPVAANGGTTNVAATNGGGETSKNPFAETTSGSGSGPSERVKLAANTAVRDSLNKVPEKDRKLSAGELEHQQALAAKVLDPKRFRTEHWQDKPMVPLSYEIAKKRPDMLERLFCYCGCDLTEKHKSLLDCFTDPDEHGSTCSECIDEAFLADRLYRDGATMARIQQMVDEEFCSKYPFSPAERTSTYTNYLAHRLYTDSTSPACGDNYRKDE